MTNHEPEGFDRFPVNRRKLLTIGAGTAAAGLSFGIISEQASAWKEFAVEFKSERELWMIVGDDLNYDPPAIAHVIVDRTTQEEDEHSFECELIEFTEEAATTTEEYGDSPVIKYKSETETVVGVVPYNRPLAGKDRFSRPRCVMRNNTLDTDSYSQSALEKAKCVKKAMKDHWDGDYRNCWFDPADPQKPPAEKELDKSFVPTDASESQLFGYQVALDRDGTVAVVGAPGDDENGQNAGAVYIFKKDKDEWVEQAKLLPTGAHEGDQFGRAVDIDRNGKNIIAGAPTKDGTGAGYLFNDGSGGWEQVEQFQPDEPTLNAEFGQSVALAGTAEHALIGSNDGAYGFVNSDGWVLQDRPFIPEDAEDIDFIEPGQRWGEVVTMNDAGDRAIMANTGVLRDYGQAHLFERDNDGWSHVSLVGGGADDHRVGVDLSITDDGQLGLLGTDVYTPVTSFLEGYALIVTEESGLFGDDSVVLQSSDGRIGDRFGRGVGLNGPGERALIGAPLHDTDVGEDAGAAYLFTKTDDEWQESRKFRAADGSAQDTFGETVAVNREGTVGIIGAPFAGENELRSGKVYVVDLE